MSLWGATDSDESKPKNLTTAEKKEVFASTKGWVREAGSILSGNDNTSATPEVLVALRGLATKLGVADITSIDFNIKNGIKDIPIEKRNEEEVSFIEGIDKDNIKRKIKITPKNTSCVNYAFDITPAKYITNLITEKGIINANIESISKLSE